VSSAFDPEASIRNGIRDWLRAGSVVPGADILDKADVIPADDKGVRPAIPYMTVKVTVLGTQVGTDEDLATVDGGVPQMKHRGERTATVSVQG